MSLQRDDLEKQCGCPEARWSKCASHAWHLVGRHAGQRISKSLNVYATRRGLPCPTTRSEGETLAARMIAEIEAGTFEDKPRASVPPAATEPGAAGQTFAQLWPTFVEAVKAPSDISPATVKMIGSRYARLARTVIPAVGPMGRSAPSTWTRDVIGAWYRVTTTGMANSTKHKYGQALTGFLDWAVERGYLESHPLPPSGRERAKALPAGPETMRTRRVYPDEEANLLQAATETQVAAGTRLVALLVLAFDLGCRLSELLALKWGDVLWHEGPRGRVVITAIEEGARKGGVGKARRVPLTARARALLLQLQVGPLGTTWSSTNYVLGDAIGERVTQVRKAWVTCVLRAHNHEPQWIKHGKNTLAPVSRARFKQIGLHFHDIRHERALRWLEEGKTLGTIAQLLGHHDLSTLRVYLGLSERDALREAEQVEDLGRDTPAVTVRRHDGARVVVTATAANDSKTTVKRPATKLRMVGQKEAAAS